MITVKPKHCVGKRMLGSKFYTHFFLYSEFVQKTNKKKTMQL